MYVSFNQIRMNAYLRAHREKYCVVPENNNQMNASSKNEEKCYYLEGENWNHFLYIFSSFSSEVIQVIDLSHSCHFRTHTLSHSGQSISNITLTINAILRFMKVSR